MTDAEPDTVLSRFGLALAEAGLAPASALTLETDLQEDLGLDSLKLMQVARHFEAAYGYRVALADWVLAQEDAERPDYRLASLAAFVAETLNAASA